MTGEVLLNGKRRRLDYGVAVSKSIYISKYISCFQSLKIFKIVKLIIQLMDSGLCDPRRCTVGNSNSERNLNILSSSEASTNFI